MSTKIEIVNMGLAHAAQSPIASLEQSSMVANFISTIYTVEMEAALADHTWRFAREFAQLNRLAALSAHQSYPQYQLPADWVRTVGLELDGVQCRSFEQSRDKLLVPAASESTVAVLEYITSNVSEPLFPPHFVEILGLRLGIRVALSVARDKALAADLRTDLENIKLPKARTVDSQQGRTQRAGTSALLARMRGARG